MMVPEEELVALGQALSHPARVRILAILAQGERCGCELAPLLGLDPSVVSRHLNLLARAGLVSSRRDGVRVLWRLASLEVWETLKSLCRSHSEKGTA